MKNKKLISILGLVAVVANLGVATVFAQTVPTSGSQNIGCRADGALTLNASNNMAFKQRSTNFAGETDANVLWDDGMPNVVIQDTRGFETRGICGTGWNLTVETPGLKYTYAGSDYNINLETGAFTNANLTEGNIITPSIPAQLIGAATLVNTTGASGNTGVAVLGKTIATSTGSFYGDVRLNLTLDNTNAIANSTGIVLVASHSTLQKVTPIGGTLHEVDGTQTPGTEYTGALPQGNYTGTVTFTLVAA